MWTQAVAWCYGAPKSSSVMIKQDGRGERCREQKMTVSLHCWHQVQSQIRVDISNKLERRQYGVPYVMYVEEVPVLKQVVPTERIAIQR